MTCPAPAITAPPLRDYQYAALAGIDRELYLQGKRSTVLVMATGTGKTRAFTEAIEMRTRRDDKVLVLVHRNELAGQALATLQKRGLAPELEKAKDRASFDAKVVVASVPTLRGKRLRRWPVDHFDLIVCDEAHHFGADSYQAIANHFAVTKLLGVTATPFKGSGKSIVGEGKPFESLAFSYGIRDAIDDGYLVPLQIDRMEIAEVDLDGVKTRGGDFVESELGELYSSEPVLHAVARPFVELAGDRQAIIFTASVAQAMLLADCINQSYAPGSALALSAGTSEDDRAAALEAYRSGELRTLVNVGLFTEGTDLPMCSCVAIARPTKSEVLYPQMVGRALRLAEGARDLAESIALGKSDALILDFVGASTRHRLANAAAIMAREDEDPDVVDAAAELLAGEERDPLAALEAAKELVEQRRKQASAQARVEYLVHKVDPFLGPVAVPDQPWARDIATINQVSRLRQEGFTPPAGMSKGEASAIISRINQRRAAGLCSINQARAIAGVAKRRGAQVNVAEMSKAVAGVLMGRLKADKYKTAAEVIERIANLDNQEQEGERDAV